MSYDPNRCSESLFVTAWSNTDTAIPIAPGTVDSSPNYTFNIDTKGLGNNVTLSNDVLTNPENINAFWIGDVRTDTRTDGEGGSDSDINYFSIAFENTSASVTAAPQDHRRSLADDLCYSIYPSAKLTMWKNEKSSGDALALYVRVIGLLTE